MKRMLLFVLCCSAIGLAGTALSADIDTVVQTKSGAVRGHVKTNYTEWLGIPYAAPPTGDLRWKAPQPVAAWSGVRDASQPGDGCVQGTGWDPGYEEPHLNENCLYLNIYRPHGVTADSGLPVFFWIHGGGLRGGAGFDTDPRKFVDLGNVIFVTHNYRLGALGFLAVPGLSAEDRDAAGVYGMLDQQAALRWVSENIAGFGGDPGNITIAGQSAGGRSVCNQIVSPANDGLFARAIHQSGGCGGDALEDAEERGARFAAELGCTEPSTAAACMRGKSPEEILAAQDKVRISTTVYGGKYFPLNATDALAAGKFNKVPVVIGQTRDERTQSLFAAYDYRGNPLTAAGYEEEIRERYGELANQVLELYPAEGYVSPLIALANAEGDDLSCERRKLYGLFAQHVPTYAYEFDERDQPAFVSIWKIAPDYPFGATHVNELGYLFDYLRNALPFSSAQGELSDTMISYWSSFTRTGDPNSSYTPAWPRYSTDSDVMMSLKAGGTAPKTSFREEHRCDFWDNADS